MKRKLCLILALVLVFAALMSGCAKKDEPEKGEVKVQKEAAANPAKARDGADTLIIGTNEVKGDFLPVYYSTVYDEYVVNLTFDPLISNDKEGNPIAHVAKDWEISDDHKTYTFHLRDDVKFSDGTPLTANDVEFTYTIMCDPSYDGRYTSAVEDIAGYQDYKDGKADKVAGIKVIDEHTISFTFNTAMPTHIWDCSQGIMPKAHYEYTKGDVKPVKDKMQDVLGSGAYVVKKYEPKQYVEFAANENYFLGAPKVKKLILKFTTAETMMSELEKGTIDVQLAVPPKGENKEIVDGAKFLNTVEFPDNGYSYMGWNLRDPRLADKKVRQALTYGFNRQQFVDLYYQGNASVCNIPLSQVSWAYTTDINEYKYDPEKAKQLLDEAGWKVGADGIREKDGKKLDFVWDTYNDSKYVETMIPMLKADWEKIGVKVEANLMEFNALVEKVYDKRDFDMYNMAWSMNLDPDSYDVFHSSQDIPSGNNSIGFRNEQNDELLAKGRTEFDQAKRAEIYQEWGKLVNDELPYMFLTQNLNWDVVNSRVKNFNTSSFVKFTNPSVILNLELEQ